MENQEDKTKTEGEKKHSTKFIFRQKGQQVLINDVFGIQQREGGFWNNDRAVISVTIPKEIEIAPDSKFFAERRPDPGIGVMTVTLHRRRQGYFLNNGLEIIFFPKTISPSKRAFFEIKSVKPIIIEDIPREQSLRNTILARLIGKPRR